MLSRLNKIIRSPQAQLNAIGVVLLCLLGLGAWQNAKELTFWSVLALIFIGYAAFRVVFELTINRANVPTLATGFAGRAKMTQILKQEAAKRGLQVYRVIDLGSGRGELTRHIAKAIPTSLVVGIERTRIPFLQSKFVQRWFGPKNLSYQCADFWSIDCRDIDAVVFYLSPSLVKKIGEKLHKELKPGSTVISHTFPMLGQWTPIEIIQFRTPFKETIYVYRKS